MFQRPPEIPVGLENLRLALYLVLRGTGHVQINLFDLAETRRDIAPRDLHPDVAQPLKRIEFAVFDLVHHGLGIVPDAVERFGNLFVARANLHGLHLLAHHVVEQRRLVERAADGDHPLLVEVGYLVEERDNRRLLGLRLGQQPEIVQAVHGLFQILHR